MQPIVVRVRGPQVAGAVVLGMGGLVFWMARHTSEQELGPVMRYGLPLLIGLYGLWCLVTGGSTLTVDDEGLRQRSFWREVFIAWRSIDDFFTVQEKHHALDFVESREEGRPSVSWFAALKQAPQLRALVLARATRARVREWAAPGTRDAEPLPDSFTYRPSQMARMGPIFTIGFLLMVGWMMRGAFLYDPSPMPRAHYLAGLMGVLSLVVGPYVALIVSSYVSMERAYATRRAQRVVVSVEGLRYHDERREVIVAWKDIDEITWSGDRLLTLPSWTVSSRRNRFEIGAGIHRVQRLVALMTRHAPAAMARSQGSATNTENLLGEVPPPGVTVCHYRTRTNRALSAFPIVVALTFVGLMLRERDPIGATVCAVCIGLPALKVYLSYRFTQIRTDAKGIVYRTWRGERRIAWGELRAWRQVKAALLSHILLEGRGERWKVWGTAFDLDGLLAALRAHRPETPAPPRRPPGTDTAL